MHNAVFTIVFIFTIAEGFGIGVAEMTQTKSIFHSNSVILDRYS